MTPGSETTEGPIGDGAVVVITTRELLDAMYAAACVHVDAGGTVRVILDPLKKGER